eukprot:gene576-622_t
MTGSYARRPVQLQELMKNQTFIDSGLTRAELVALRLFTGPMFMKYNCVLRGYPQEIARNLKGNRYITTIHTIASGIVKLSRVAELPENRKVYRGLGGMILPEKFWKPDKYGCRGGVEYGFMSTTTQRDVALMYSGKEGQLRTIFEMDVGQIDRGANIQWLSQYPAEKEFLVPPLSNLEVIDQPRLEMHEDGTQILIIRLRVNVNFRSKTLEQLKATRKRLHLATMGNLIADTKRKLCVPDDDPDGILASFYRLLEEERGKADEWFNDDANYRKCQEDMMGLKMGTIRQDQLIRLARRCLLGEPSDEIDQRDIELSLKEVMGLDSGAGIAVGGEVVPRAVLKDEEITDEELNKLKELLVVLSARNPRLTLFSGKQSSSIHMGSLSSSETDRMLRMLFRVFVHYECSRGGAEGRDITSWLHLLETDADVQRDVERERKSPWTLPAKPGERVERVKLSFHELSNVLLHLEALVCTRWRFQWPLDELRRRCELQRLEAELRLIDEDAAHWLVGYEERSALRSKRFQELDRSKVQADLSALRQEDLSGQSALMSWTEIKIGLLQHESSVAIEKTTNADILKLAYSYALERLDRGDEKDGESGKALPTIARDILLLVEKSTKERCAHYAKDPGTLPEDVCVHSSLAEVKYTATVSGDELSDAQRLLQKYERRYSADVVKLASMFLDVESMLEALKVFAEDRLRGTKEALHMYVDLCGVLSAVQDQDVTETSFSEDSCRKIHDICWWHCRRAAVYSRIADYVALLEALDLISSNSTLVTDQGDDAITLRCYGLLAVELRWRVTCYRVLKAHPDFQLLRAMERRLRYGIGGDGAGDDVCMSGVVKRVMSFETELFAHEDFSNRLEGVIRLLSIHADDESLPWLNEFDADAAMQCPTSVLAACRDREFSRSPLYPLYESTENFADVFQCRTSRSMLEQKCIGERLVDNDFGTQIDKTSLSDDDEDSKRISGAVSSGWGKELPLRDEARYTKEIYWALLARNRRNKYGAQTIRALSRRTVYRLLEVAISMLDYRGMRGVEEGAALAGFAGLSIEDSFKTLRERLGASTANLIPSINNKISKVSVVATDTATIKHLDISEKQNHLWLGALAVHLDRVGRFQMKIIAGNKVSAVAYHSLTPPEIQFLVGLVFFSKSTVKFNVGPTELPAVRLQCLNPWHIDDSDDRFQSGPHDTLKVAVGPGMLDVMSAILSCRELSVFPNDKRFDRVDLCTVSTGSLINKEEVKRCFDAFQTIQVRTNLESAEAVQSLSKILSKFRRIKGLDMGHCKINCVGLGLLVPTLKAYADSMKELSLDGNNIGVDGSVVLGDVLSCYASLKKLSLNECRIGSKGLTAVLRALKCSRTSLVKLECKENFLTDESVE